MAKPKEKKDTKLKKRKKKEYWGKQEEAAVIDYLSYPAGHPKSEYIFANLLYLPLKKLVESIMFTYHLTIPELPIDEQIYDCMSFVTSKMRKFDHTKGYKSFSYFGTIAKNDMIVKKNKHHKKKIISIEIEKIEGFEMKHGLCEIHNYESKLNSNEFLFKILSADLKEMIHSDITLDPNIYKVGEAVVYLLDNYQYINLQNKRQFYFIVKEITGLSAKEITSAMVKIKEVFEKTYRNENDER